MVENDTLLRQGFVNLLRREYFVRHIYEAANAVEFETQIKTNTVDIVLLDVHLGEVSGVELLLKLRKQPMPPKVIVVTGLEGVELIINLLKTGVDAIVSKLDGYAEVLKAIKEVLKGGTHFPERVILAIKNNAHRWESVPPVILTTREKELLKMLAKGLTTKEIAAYLKMTEATIETYRIRLVKKVKASNTASLIAYAYVNGIL